MKLLFLFVFLNGISFSQVSLSELRKLVRVDSDSFEVYALERGYTHFKVLNELSCKGLVYGYYDGSETRYLTTYTEYYGDPIPVGYQTGNEAEMIKFYNELKTLGFTLEYKDYDDENVIYKIYRKDREELKLVIHIDAKSYELKYSQL
jgi:hypothetical protein